jgi:hydrogenase nickel incorporation protein HypA/HybF
MVRIIEEQARAQAFSRVKTVFVEVGALSGAEPEALLFGFDVVAKGTIAEGATLEIIPIPAQAWCLPCGETIALQQRFDPCPRCGGYQLQITGGDELRIRELEVE